jgi:hypothetical protein
MKKCVFVYVGKCLLRKAGSQFDYEFETDVRKCLRQTSKDLYTASFDAIGQAHVNVDGDVEE